MKSSELFFLLKQFLKTQEKLKEFKFCIKIQSAHVFIDIAKFADFLRKIADVSRTHRMCHMIHIFFESFLGKV